MSASIEQLETFVQILTERARRSPNDVLLRFLGDGETVTETVTYANAYERVTAVARRLAAETQPGDRALLLYPSGPEYVFAFLGCLFAGVIAVPAYPPESAHPRSLTRLLTITRDAGPRVVLTESALVAALRAAQALVPDLASALIVATDERGELGAADVAPRNEPSGLAFLQYTSGSTARPKGVAVSHENLIANSKAIRTAFGMQDDDVVVSWLPLFHDMGLIGGLLQPIYSGVPLVLMSPRHFMERPARWLHAIARHGGSVSGGPDFAYRFATERVAELAGLELDRWRLAFCGAEPVRARTLAGFADRFSRCGFDARAFYPCYGLAEATLFVAGGKRGDGFVPRGFDEKELACGRGVESAEGARLVSCGCAADGHSVLLIDPGTEKPVDGGKIGEIWVAGPSVARGYWQQEEATRQAFVERGGAVYLRTGDLGFERDGRLFVTGRRKDLIIVRGQNVYPQDVEASIEDQFEVVRKGRVAAFAFEHDGRETIGVALEIGRRFKPFVQAAALTRAVAEAIALSHGEHPGLVLLLNPGALPLTSSGKLQRALCRRSWESRTLDVFAAYQGGALLFEHKDAPVELETTT